MRESLRLSRSSPEQPYTRRLTAHCVWEWKDNIRDAGELWETMDHSLIGSVRPLAGGAAVEGAPAADGQAAESVDVPLRPFEDWLDALEGSAQLQVAASPPPPCPRVRLPLSVVTCGVAQVLEDLRDSCDLGVQTKLGRLNAAQVRRGRTPPRPRRQRAELLRLPPPRSCRRSRRPSQ